MHEEGDLTQMRPTAVARAGQGNRPMRMPDFFIIGAPKCGTTAIYSYLFSRTDVFLSRIKSPHFFSYDLPGRRDILNEQEYLGLFESAPPHVILGEASASYLFSEVAIQKIMERIPTARMIAILRNPIDAAHAFHSERRYNLNEDIPDFELAWRLQEERARGRRIPRFCREPKLLQYREMCSFGRQIRRFFALVPESQRLVCIFEEFTMNPRRTYMEILRLLGLPDDGRSEFPRVNASKALRSRGLAEWHRAARTGSGKWYRSLKLVANGVGFYPSHLLGRINVKERPRVPLTPHFRRQLAAEFSQDVRDLEELLGRRLMCWKDFNFGDRTES